MFKNMKIESILSGIKGQSSHRSKMGNSTGSSPTSNKANVCPEVHNFGEHSISDILCVSIPEEYDEEESKS
jgi:hypothetical protein